MRCWYPRLSLSALDPQPDPGTDDRWGGRGRGFPADRWPLDQQRNPCPPLARLHHHPQRLDLGRDGRVLFVFLAVEWFNERFTDSLRAGGVAIVLEPEEFDLDEPGLAAGHTAYTEARVVEWEVGDDGIRDDHIPYLMNAEQFLQLGWIEPYFEMAHRPKVGGAPLWTGNGPVVSLGPRLRYLGQCSGDYLFDGDAPEPDDIGAPRIIWRRKPGDNPWARYADRTEPRHVNPDAPAYYSVHEGAGGWVVPYANFASDGIGFMLSAGGDPPTMHFPISR